MMKTQLVLILYNRITTKHWRMSHMLIEMVNDAIIVQSCLLIEGETHQHFPVMPNVDERSNRYLEENDRM